MSGWQAGTQAHLIFSVQLQLLWLCVWWSFIWAVCEVVRHTPHLCIERVKVYKADYGWRQVYDDYLAGFVMLAAMNTWCDMEQG